MVILKSTALVSSFGIVSHKQGYLFDKLAQTSCSPNNISKKITFLVMKGKSHRETMNIDWVIQVSCRRKVFVMIYLNKNTCKPKCTIV